MKIREKICKKCNGLGIEVINDEWCGRLENICTSCQGKGTYLEGIYGYQVYYLIQEKFLILDKGDILHLYIQRPDGIYLWANWLMASIGKVEEEYAYLESVDELEEVQDDLKLLISLFYYSDELHIYCEGTPYSRLHDEGLCGICGKDALPEDDFCEEHQEAFQKFMVEGKI